MSNNDEYTFGMYFIGLPTMQPIKNVTNSIVDKVELTRSNKMLADDLKDLQPIIRMLKNNQWSCDVDPNCHKKNMIMEILNDFDAP